MTGDLLVTRHDSFVVLSLNRPKVLNALSSDLRRSLIAALQDAEADDDIGAIVLTGVGRAFCAGIDLKEIAGSGVSVDENVAAENVATALAHCSKPVIGAINGMAVTGGFEISLACDILIAGESASFADTHVRVGINPGWGLSQRLSRRIGLSRAKELSLTGRRMSARQALEWGLVNHVFADADLMASAEQLASAITANDQMHVRRMKAIIDTGYSMHLDDGLELEAKRASELNLGVSATEVAQGHIRARTQAIGEHQA